MEDMKSDDNDKRINVTNENEIIHWSKEYGVSEVRIRAAIQAVGTKVEDVQAYLKKMDEKFGQ